MNLPPSRGRDMIAMVLNKQLAEKFNKGIQQSKATSLECEKDDDPDFIPESNSEESEDNENETVECTEENLNEISSEVVNVPEDNLESEGSTEIVNYIINTILDNCFNSFTIRGERRKRRKYETTVEERKRLKASEIIAKHTLKPPCTDKCKRKCIEKITHDRRAEINSLFWKMAPKERKTFMFNTTTKIETKRNTTDHNDSRRKFTIQYSFKNAEGNSQDVCKVFFMSTLGFKERNDKILRNVLRTTSTASLQALEDRRGQHAPTNKIDKAPLIEHINSFRPSISHYRREHAPNRKYLPSDINIHMMYEDFIERNRGIQCSYEFYRKTVRELNISFVKLGHEECFSCEKFFIHEKNSSHMRDKLDLSCINCQEYNTHIKKSDAARKYYQEDGENVDGKSIYSADLQKVIMLPRYESLKEVIFTPRIIAFNESFVPVGKKQKNKKPVAIIWHEGVSGRSKNDIISTFHSFFIYNRDEKHIVLWLDNCSSQNKNWALLAFFIFVVNSNDFNLFKLEIKFFEPGHTFMSADSFHHQVEMSLKKKRKVLDFSDFEEAVQKSNSGKVHVINMQYNNFYNWGDFTSNYKLNKIVPRPYLQQMVHLEFTRGEYTMKYKTCFSEEAINLNFLTAAVLKKGFPKPTQRTENRGIAADRKQMIIAKLGPIMPKNRIKFWEDLYVPSNVAPLDEADQDI